MQENVDDCLEYAKYALSDFQNNRDVEDSEIRLFNEWKKIVVKAQKLTHGVPHLTAQTPITEILNANGNPSRLINLSSYNYLGYSYHPEVIAAAQEAIQRYGLGATGSPVLNGTFLIHKVLQEKLLEFLGLDSYGVSLFSSGYSANVGTISGYLGKGDFVLLDSYAHASLVDGALLARARPKWFRHNDMGHLEQLLKDIREKHKTAKIMICTEGVYSADGDFGNLVKVCELAKKYRAKTLVDEAHSFLIAGPTGKGVCEAQDVLNDVDMIILTFSKSFGGIGGCLIAKAEMTAYLDYFARSRMFSCALDPGVTGGLIKVLELASGDDGATRRQRLLSNAAYFYDKLQSRVPVGRAGTWVLPIIYGDELMTLPLGAHLQKAGLDVSLMTYPSVPKRQARIRAFITSEHTREQLDQAAAILTDAAEQFSFLKIATADACI